MVEARYSRNIGAITRDEQDLLSRKKVFIAGCGGLGGYILSNLVRVGVGHITAIDGDCFDETNLNRQLLCTEDTLGQPKAKIAADHTARVNSSVQIAVKKVFLNQDNCPGLISGHDLVIDALDNIESRIILAKECDALGIPYVYGAIRGWNAQIGFFPAGTASERIAMLYPRKTREKSLKDKSSLSFTPALCASYQSAEAVKYLINRGNLLSDRILYADLLEQEFEEIPFL